MAQIQPNPPAEPRWSRGPGRKAARYGVPVALAGIAAAGIGLVPALADTGDPNLPPISAEDLVAKMATSDVDQLTGTVRLSSDLGLPAVPGGGAGGGQGGGPFAGGSGGAGGPGKHGGQGGADGNTQGGGENAGEGSPAAPSRKLMELASGEHLLRVAADGPKKQRVSVVEDAAEYSLIHKGNEVWAYDSATNSAFHGVAPKTAGNGSQQKGQHGKHQLPEGMANLTPQEAADKAIAAAGDTTTVSVDGTAKVAGRDAYQLVIEPKDASQSTIGSIRIAVDAENGAPLKFTLTPEGGGDPALDIAYTDIDFGEPEAGTFSFTPPEGAEVTEKHFGKDVGEGREARPHRQAALSGLEFLGEGWDTVARFELPEGDPGRPGDKGLEKLDSPQAQRLLESFTDEVNGEFGSGRIFESRLVNALITDDGTLYVGAVTKEGLIDAAGGATKK